MYHYDLRQDRKSALVLRLRGRHSRRGTPLYTIHHNPLQPHMFAIGGNDPRAHVYDMRTLRLVDPDTSTEP